MTKEELIRFWLDSSDANYQSMLNMFQAGEYTWSLFIGHLVIEKMLKAYYIKAVNREVPRTHDLYKLALQAKLNMTENQKDSLQYITLFNIETRYEEYKKDFYKKCTKEFAATNIEKIKELREWLKPKTSN
ncbi:MAG: DNA-binding protein [Nitrospirae bacterium CG_4_10_14_3_um_filter_53_41]|nr:MAG: DNA-binding protein [Nitrospirae bacterium CG17_big_fil_post_rev_8_21_14_2_50_50_9]PIX86914.1 MAG: DNA-binding protein [Nitrospirae bacterium CG_4_10_14_3_um_filter_53_41]